MVLRTINLLLEEESQPFKAWGSSSVIEKPDQS
jgi:hypothetical protein